MALDSIETARKEIAKIYIAAFNRVPDEGGLQNWMNQYTAGLMTYAQIATDFTNQAEYIAAYPSYLTSSEYITEIYENVFGRSPDAGGLQNWINQIDNPTVSGISRTTVMYEMLESASAAGNTDGERLDNQAEFGVQSVLDGVPTVAATAQLVNITSNDATVAAATAAVANSANSINGSTFTLTTGADAVTGTVYNDTIVATEASLSSADVLDGNEGTDTLRYASSGAVAINESGFEATNIETVQVTSDAAGGTTFDVTGVSELTTLKNYNSSEDLTFTGADALATVVLDNLGATDRATEIVDTTVTYNAAVVAGTADTQSVTLNGNMNVDGSSVGTLTVNGIETMDVTTATAASIIDSVVSNTLKAVRVAGDKALTLGNTTNGTGLTLNDTTAANTVDASTMTAALNLVLSNDNTKDVEVSTGSANDTVTFVSFDTDDTFDGNDGTDTISLTNATAILRTTTNGGTLTDVEQLNVNTAGTGTIDMDAFSGVTKVIFDADITAAATSTVDDAVTGITVEVDTSATTGTLVVDLKTDGTADEITIELDDIAAGEAITSIDAADAETLNISVDDDTTNGVGAMTITSLTATDATTLNLSGDADLTIAAVVDPATPVLATVNASTMTGDLTISGMNTKATGATITLGAGDDTYNVATSNGADTITLGAGLDTIVYNAVAQSDDDMDTITDFTQGEDVIDLMTLTNANINTSTLFLGTRANFALAQGALDATTTGNAVFQADESILWVDIDDNGTLDNADFRIKLDGITTLTAADLGFGTGNTVTLTAAAAVVTTTGSTGADVDTTNEDDTINTTVAFSVGSTFDGALGTDTLNVTDTTGNGTIDLDDSAADVENIEVITLGAGVDQINLLAADFAANAAGEITTITGNSSNAQLLLTDGADLTETVVTNIESYQSTGNTSLDEADVDTFTTQIDLNSANQTLTLDAITDGIFDFTTTDIADTDGGANDNIILGLAADDEDVKAIFNATDLAGVDTITGDGTDGVLDTLEFADATSLATKTITEIDTFIMNSSTANQTLTIDGDDYTAIAGADAALGVTITGDGDSNLTFAVGGGAAALDLSDATISGFDTIDVSAATAMLTLDTASISGTTVTLVGDATDDITLTGTSGANADYSNLVLTAGDFNEIVLGTGVTAVVNSAFFNSTVDTITGVAGGAAENFIIYAASGATVDLDFVTTVTNITAVTVNDSTGVETIDLAVAGTDQDSIQEITTITLTADSSSDVILLDNHDHDAQNALGLTINGFIAGVGANADEINITLTDNAVHGNFTTVTAAATAFADVAAGVVEVASSVVTVTDLTAVANGLEVEAAIATAIGTSTANNAGGADYLVILYGSGADSGMAGVYEVHTTSNNADEAAGTITVDLLGIFNGITADSFVSGNFI